MKKTNLLAKMDATAKAQVAESHDKFAKADIAIAMRNAAAGNDGGPSSTMALAPEQAVKTLVPNLLAPVAAATDVRELPLRIVKDHPRNARHLYDPAKIDDMATTIARDGQLYPAIVMPDEADPGTYLLIDGRYRKRALIALGRETILVRIVPAMSELEAYRHSLLLNDERNEQTDLDNALSWKGLLADKVFLSQEHIAEFLNISQSKVSKTLALLDLPDGVLSIMKTSPGSFGIRIGYELLQLKKTFSEKELEGVAEQVKDGKLTVAALEKFRSKGERQPVTRERSRAYSLKAGDIKFGTVRDFDDGRLKIDLSNAPGELKEKIIKAVQSVLAEVAAG